MARENTNLASEFFVLSTLHRLEADALLTLGHHKAVDIAVVRNPGRTKTLDVKGAATRDWFIDGLTKFQRNHYIVFVGYNNVIGDLAVAPEVYIVPSLEVPLMTYTSPGEKPRRVVRLTTLRGLARRYRDRWDRLT
jgi:hypothetical protein